MVSDLINVDLAQQLLEPWFTQRVTPILDLRVTREQHEFVTNLEQQDQAGIVHLFVETSHDRQHHFRRQVAQSVTEPTRIYRCAIADELRK